MGSLPLAHARRKAVAVAVAVAAGAWAMALDVLEDYGGEASDQRIARCTKHGFLSFPSDRRKILLPVGPIRAEYAGDRL